MKKTSNKIVFFGNERLATGVITQAPTLRALINAGYTIAAVVSNYEKGRSRNARELEIATVAEQHNIPLLLPAHPREITEQLKNYGASIGVLVAYGKLVPESIINIFPKGIVNIHPSLLPELRGPTPIEQVILDGAVKTGVSIMQLVKEMDAGPVFAQSELRLKGNETKQDLADKLLSIGSSMLIEVLPGIVDGSLVGKPQDESRATYDALITKQDGQVAWDKPAIQLEREIRAFQGWPKSKTSLGDKDITIIEASVVKDQGTPGKTVAQGKKLIVYTGKDALSISRLKPAGKQEMTSEAFIAGHKNLFV